MSSTLRCTFVSPTCPVKATIYGYTPNLAANAIFTAVFAVLAVAQLFLGIWKRTYAFAAFVFAGTLLELLGYIGRLLLRDNVWNESALSLQLVCLILGPTFLAGGLYVTIKHVVLGISPDQSRIAPHLYPWIFLSCDAASIAIQAIGGGITAAAGSGASPVVLSVGGDLIMAGIAFQIFTMAVFCALAVEYYIRVPHSASPHGDPDQDANGNISTNDLRYFVTAMAGAYVLILVRCIYRIHEFAGGWGNPRMRDEATFLILDGGMVALACVLLTVAHPGIMFPTMRQKTSQVLEGAYVVDSSA